MLEKAKVEWGDLQLVQEVIVSVQAVDIRVHTLREHPAINRIALNAELA